MSDWNIERPLGIDGLLKHVAARVAAAQCEHRNGSHFDRTLCPPPCSSAHQVCNDCGVPVDRCVLDPATDHWPMYVRWENRHTVPAEVCDTCSNAETGHWVPVCDCAAAMARLAVNPDCTYTYGVLRAE